MRYVVVGGGVAGVCCVNQLLKRIQEDDEVVLISASSCVKTVTNWRKVGQFAEFFNVVEDTMFISDPRFRLKFGFVDSWTNDKVLFLKCGERISFDKLCIATGASPRKPPIEDPRVITLRDSHSANKLQQLLEGCRHVAIVGNGGIATELVYELKNLEISWIINSASISSTFFLPQIEIFLENRMKSGRSEGTKNSGVQKRIRFSTDLSECSSSSGCALGPDWSTVACLHGAGDEHTVTIYRNARVQRLSTNGQISLQLSTSEDVKCDAVIWATGVEPNSALWAQNSGIKLADDRGIVVDKQMKTSVKDVYACGDVCTVNWDSPSSWQQMRLWTQARQMGYYTANCMTSKATELDFCFEMFAHVTTFFGFKVVLLGNFLARNLKDWYVVQREVPHEQLACCIMANHRVVGAILIGETDLEETIENLILNGTDMELLEDHFLDSGIDIESYFD